MSPFAGTVAELHPALTCTGWIVELSRHPLPLPFVQEEYEAARLELQEAVASGRATIETLERKLLGGGSQDSNNSAVAEPVPSIKWVDCSSPTRTRCCERGKGGEGAGHCDS